MTMFSAKRLGKELQKAKDRLPPGIELIKADDFDVWLVDIRVLDDNPLYLDEVYRLRFKFGDTYPIQPPEVIFVNVPASAAPSTTSSEASDQSITPNPQSSSSRPIPIHPHIYSNGIICLDLLGSEGWSPVQSVESICMSIQSMLTGNKRDERPEGDEDFCRSMVMGSRRGVRDVRFIYDDPTV